MAEEPRPEDPELVAVRELAAEVVRAAGGVPIRRGYRVRLEPRRRMSAPLQLVSGLVGVRASIRRNPRRALAFGLAGCGAVAAVVLILRAAIVPGDASLELIATRPAPSPAVPAPPAPPETLIVEAPARVAPPPAAPPAPAAPATPVAPVATRDALRALGAEKPTPARAAPAASKRGAAAKKLASAGGAAQRRAGRRMDGSLAGAGRVKAAAELPSSTARGRGAGKLDRREILAGMQPIQLLVQRCYQRYGEKGVANAGIEVGKHGEVKKVTIAGPLARTSTAACLKSAVKTAHFAGGSTTFHYPLVVQ